CAAQNRHSAFQSYSNTCAPSWALISKSTTSRPTVSYEDQLTVTYRGTPLNRALPQRQAWIAVGAATSCGHRHLHGRKGAQTRTQIPDQEPQCMGAGPRKAVRYISRRWPKWSFTAKCCVWKLSNRGANEAASGTPAA